MKTHSHLLLSQKAIVIRRPASTVFEFLSNHENYIQWFPGVVRVSSANDLPHGTSGKQYTETLQLPGSQATFTIWVVESQPPHTFATEGDLRFIHPRMELRLTEESETETTVRLTFASRSRSFLGRLLVGTLVKGSFKRQTEVGLLRLQKLLEGQAVMD